MHPGIKLRHLRAFLAIAAEGNLSPVARAQGITPPALSRTLAELETLLGQPRFLRQGRRLVLTEAGALFRRHAAAGLQALEAGAAALAPGQSGTIRVGVLPTVATRFMPRLAIRFRALRPDILLAVETGPHHYIMRLLREGAIDVMFGRLPGAAEIAGLRFDHLYEEDVVAVARAGHPLAGLSVSEILPRVPLMLPPATAIIRRAVEDYLATLGLAHLRPAYETASLALGRGVVLRSDAVWFISRGVVAEELEAGAMVALPAEARFLSGAVGITRRQAGGSLALDALAALAQDLAAE